MDGENECDIGIAWWNITSWSVRDQELIIKMEAHKIGRCGFSEARKKERGILSYIAEETRISSRITLKIYSILNVEY